MPFLLCLSLSELSAAFFGLIVGGPAMLREAGVAAPDELSAWERPWSERGAAVLHVVVDGTVAAWNRLDTEVVETGDDGGRPYAVLAATILYPEGGGQPADRGRLGLALGNLIAKQSLVLLVLPQLKAQLLNQGIGLDIGVYPFLRGHASIHIAVTNILFKRDKKNNNRPSIG